MRIKYNYVSTKVKIDRLNIVSVLLFLFVLVEIGTFLFCTTYLFRNGCLVIIGSLSVAYSLMRNGLKTNRFFVRFVIVYSLCGLLSMLVNQNADVQELLWPLAYMGVGLLLLNFKIPFRFIRLLYFAVSMLFVIEIVVHGGVDNLELLSSRNSLSIYELQLWSIYMVSAHQNKKNVEYWTILLGLFVSVISIGRGGILTFVIMLGVFVLYKYEKGIAKRATIGRIIVYLGVLTVGVCFVYYKYSDLINQMIYNLKWRGLETKRIQIWKDYIGVARSSAVYVVFGAPQRGTFWLDKYADNLHNSFLELHAKYGLFMFMYVFIKLWKLACQWFRNKQIYLLIPLIGMIIRMNLD